MHTNTRHRLGITSVAIVLLAALGACSDDEPTVSKAAPDDDAMTTSTTTSSPEPGCQEVAYDRLLAPGCWAIQVEGVADLPLAGLDVPASGLVGNDAWVWRNAEPDEWGALTLTTAGGVYPDPCDRNGTAPEASTTIEAFAAALGSQAVTTMAAPVPVTVGGHEGLYVEYTVPSGFDPRTCRDKELAIWQPTDGETVGADPGQVTRLWIVDVAGNHMVLYLGTHAEATDETVELFSGLAESARFVEG